MSDLEENKLNNEVSDSNETNKDGANPNVSEVEKQIEVTESSEYNEGTKGRATAVKATTAVAATVLSNHQKYHFVLLMLFRIHLNL